MYVTTCCSRFDTSAKIVSGSFLLTAAVPPHLAHHITPRYCSCGPLRLSGYSYTHFFCDLDKDQFLSLQFLVNGCQYIYIYIRCGCRRRVITSDFLLVRKVPAINSTQQCVSAIHIHVI